MKEHYYDKLFHIKTGEEQKGVNRSIHYHRYESTPYHALEILFNEYEINKNDRFVDFGCGKGRLNFYIHHFFHVPVIGLEMNRNYYQEAVKNRYRYIEKYPTNQNNIHFQLCLAEEYQVDQRENRFYFFNPFSVHIFTRVINNILRSIEIFDREVELIIYYGSDDYIFYLEHQSVFELKKEIMIPGSIQRDPYERFLIYHIPSLKCVRGGV